MPSVQRFGGGSRLVDTVLSQLCHDYEQKVPGSCAPEKTEGTVVLEEANLGDLGLQEKELGLYRQEWKRGLWDEYHSHTCAQSWPTLHCRPSMLAVPAAQLLGQSGNFFLVGLFGTSLGMG